MTTYTYKCKFPFKGAVWHKVEADNMASARRKFVHGSTYGPKDVICKRVTNKMMPCPKCGTPMKKTELMGHANIWECPKCGYKKRTWRRR